MGRVHGMDLGLGMGQETGGNICDVERLSSTDVERLSFPLHIAFVVMSRGFLG